MLVYAICLRMQAHGMLGTTTLGTTTMATAMLAIAMLVIISRATLLAVQQLHPCEPVLG